MTILIAYGTIDGQTGKIARFIRDMLREREVEAQLYDTHGQGGSLSFSGVDGVILAASVHERRHPKEFEVFLTAHQAEIAACRSLFLSVSLSAAFPEGQEEAQAYADEMKMRTGLVPDHEVMVAGAVRTASYDYYAAQVLKHVVLRGRDLDPNIDEYECTDWDALKQEVEGFLQS